MATAIQPKLLGLRQHVRNPLIGIGQRAPVAK